VSLALFSAPTTFELVRALDQGRRRARAGAARAAILDPTPERIAEARKITERGKPWRGRDGIWFSPRGLLADGGKLAFVFPGVDASFEPHIDDVATHFSLPLPACTKPRDLQELGVAIIGVNRVLDAAVRRIGALPDDVAGHSVGEWSGMITSGMLPHEAVDRFVSELDPDSLKVPGVVFASAGCGLEQAKGAIEGLRDIALSHDNCPHQVLVCGIEHSIDVALERLKDQGVLCQKLSFQSGFHSPLYADYLGPHRENFAGLPLRAPHTPLWSATTCAPYPETPDAIRALAVEHLVRPVRFRELTLAMYDNGTRVFVQVGVGSVVNFVEDTLRGRPHAAIAANVKERGGMDQLRRVTALLFVEGVDVDASVVSAPDDGVDLPPDHPVLLEFFESMAAIADAERDVLARLGLARAAHRRESDAVRDLSVETIPELVDHALVRQPVGWPVLADREPVVPMTTLVDLMIEHASTLVPGRVPIELEEVRAHRWLVVAPPVRADIHCRLEAEGRVHVTIGNYCEGVVIFADAYPPAPPPDMEPLADSAPASVAALALYDENWLFHGPAFRGIVDVGVLGSDGIRGTIETGRARGALLDNAGQLFGYWVMARHETDRMAMPVRLGRVRLFDRHPDPGERLECTVRVRAVDGASVVGDLSLAREGRVWAIVEGWEKRRIETDARLWSVIRFPENNLLSDMQPEGFSLYEDRYKSGATRERIARRFLGERERRDYETQTPRRRRPWLAGRIAAKDAVRDLSWKLGHGPLFPVEIAIANEPSGKPVASAPGGRDVHVSISHKDDVAVAIASDRHPVGIDIERVASREDSFAEVSFTKDELRLVHGDPKDEAWTRLWSAKEAAAKAAGTGLSGSPARFPVRDRAGERLLVGDTWVSTKRHGDFVVAWTRP
jgi:acyl transferase domain-containing protein